MKKLILLFLLIASPAYAEQWICYESQTIDTVTYNAVSKAVEGDCNGLGLCSGLNNTGLAGNCFEATVSEFIASGNVFANVNQFGAVGSRITLLSQIDIDTINAFNLQQAILAGRAGSKEQFNQVYLKAFIKILLNEINIQRQWTVSFKAEVAAATNLADLKARVATLPTLNDRTITQLRNAIDNEIDAGTSE